VARTMVNGSSNSDWRFPGLAAISDRGGAEETHSPFLMPEAAAPAAPDWSGETAWAEAPPAAPATAVFEYEVPPPHDAFSGEAIAAPYLETAAPGEAAAAAETDRYMAVRPALSPHYAHLPDDHIALNAGGAPAVVALHQALASQAPLHATLAVLLGGAGRRSMPLHGTEVPIAVYLRHLAQLFREAADHHDAGLGSHLVALEAEAPSPPHTGGSTVAAPPHAVAGWPLGVDLYSGQHMDAAAFANLKRRGKLFAIVKSSQGLFADTAFGSYYGMARAAGLLRGSYHFFANKSPGVSQPWFHGVVADQADTVIRLVKRLLPGDLAPALDLEDEPRPPAQRYPLDQGILPAQQGYHYRHIRGNPTWQHGVNDLLADIRSFQNRVETALGRTPLIYTSRMWRDSDLMDDPKVMSEYPLWTVYHGERDLNTISVGGWGTDWDFIQYAEDGKYYWGMNPYHEPGIPVTGIDFTAYKGTIHGLLGLADIGRVGVAAAGGSRYVAQSLWPDGHQHLRIGPNWTDQNLSGAGVPDGGDPVLLAVHSGLVTYFRSGDHIVEASASGPNFTTWTSTRIDQPGDAKPVHDPRALAIGDTRYVGYWGDDDDWYLLTVAGGHAGSAKALSAAGVKTSPSHGQSSGQPSLYVSGSVVHLIGRAGNEGHLFDVWQDAHGSWHQEDVTALARAKVAATPAATYSPCAVETSDGVGIVFRGVGGELWIVRRRDNAATNLAAAAQATLAAGHPACFAMQDKPHIVFRGTDRFMHEIWPENGAWKTRRICDAKIASDPAAAMDGRNAVVAVQAMDGTVQVATFDGANWRCDPAAALK